MKPVTQKTPNDCMKVCIASIIEYDYEDVPTYLEKDIWLCRYKLWLWEQGWNLRARYSRPATADYYIAQYRTASGGTHAVIAKQDVPVFDPSPYHVPVIAEPIRFYSLERLSENT